MKRNRFLKNSTAVILAILMGLLLPVQVYASTLPEDDTVYSSFDNIQTESESVGNILCELETERNEYSKTFLLDDGTTMLAEYSQPAHFKDSNGNWTEYDNSLSTATSDEAVPEYSNKASDIKVKVSQKAKSNNMIKLQSDDYKISWGYENANKSRGVINKNSEKLSGNEKFTTLKNAVSEITYSNVYTDVDLQYFITSIGVKENIILKSANVPNEFNVNYKINNLTAKQTDETTISLYNKKGEEVYTIEAPYMVDADGNTSTQLKIEIINQKGSNLQVKLTADYWFIHSLGRAFPVTIDPEVKKKVKSDLIFSEVENNIEHAHGGYFTASNAYSIIKLKSLPELNENEKIVNATFDLDIYKGSNLFTNTNDAIITNLHRAKTTASPYYYSDVIDYDAVTPKSYNSIHFDITKLMKQWYDGSIENDGFAIEALDTVGNRTLTFYQGTRLTENPILKIVYKDFSGIEDNLSYHSVSVGNDAQAQISDYLGNLVINQSLYEGTGSRMPASITATYNSVNYNTIFGNGSPSGYGWQFSFNQYIREADTTLAELGYNYIYTDADGTDHYMKKTDNSEEWVDEDGLGLTLTKDNRNIYIDNGTAKQTYELTSAGGKLLSEKDEYNNTITYGYTDGNLTSITDGSGRVTSLTYYTNSNGDKRVSKITRPDGRNIIFSYTSSEYDKIHYLYLSSTKVSRFFYNSSNLLTTVEQGYFESGNYKRQSSVKFTYNNAGQVTKITEYGSDNTEGNYLNIKYGDDNTTLFTDRQGRSETYTFDNYGNKISTLNANGYISTDSSSGLSVSSGADSFTKNYITESTEQSAIGNGKYFHVYNGYYLNVASKGGICEIDRSEPSEENGKVQYFGSTSLKITNPVGNDNDAFFTGISHEFNTTAFNGKDVTFSAYVKTKNIKKIFNGGTIGAALNIKCYDIHGNIIKDINSMGIEGTQDWQRLSVTASITTNTRFIYVSCMVRHASGTAWFDCLQLEEGSCANDFNALQNADFETNSNWLTNDNSAITVNNGTVTISGEAGAIPHEKVSAENAGDDNTEETQPATYYRTETETEPNDSIDTYDKYGNIIKTEQGFVTRTVKKTYEVDTNENTPEETDVPANDETTNEATGNNDSLGNKYIYQIVNVDRAGVSFNFSGEAKAKSVSLSNSNRTFGLAMNIYYANNSTPETHYQEFNAYTSEKQSVAMSVTPENTNNLIDYIAIAFVYGYNENEMTVYNANLNIASAYSTENTSDNSASDDKSVDYEVISESVDKTQTYMQTSSTYDSKGNYVSSETDEAGNTVSYTYDVNGNVISKIDGNENEVKYTYDLENHPLSVSSNGSQNTYTYNGAGSVSAIAHNGFSYKFNYDVFNNLISTKIGNVTVVSNTYSANNGNLIRTDYANGDYIEYKYDEYDNIIQIIGETGTIADFIYNKKGLVARAVDRSTVNTTYYYYDFSGNLINQFTQTPYGNLVRYTYYDENGNAIEKTDVDGKTKTITRGTDEDGNSFVSNDGVKADTITDDFGRTTQIKTSRGEGNSVFFTDYEYAQGRQENSTTNQVSKITQKYGTKQLVKYEYEYDANGNIDTVKQDGKIVARYSYDELDQLMWAADTNTGLYINYQYDSAGNITKVREHTLNTTNWAPGALQSERTYSYTDTNWKDKLTNYNGTKITYDAIGNPLSYRDGMTMTWQNGRQLSTLQTENNSVSYKYNSNGLRTQKTDNSGTTDYYYDSNNNLIGLTKSNRTLFFYYDTEGSPTSFSYNGEMYYYIKNLQGDIVKVINQAGVTYANYVYDAFGNILEAYGDPIISKLSPFRYRGYVYDIETGLYYLQSRYYDPVTGRFLNADVYCDTQTGTPLSTNMFAYCENNSICRTDSDGKGWINVIQAIVIAAAYTMRLTLMMYIYSATGARLNNNISLNDWWNPIGQAMKSRLKSSKKVKDRINQYISKVSKKKTTYSKKASIKFSYSSKTTADLDLAYSVGSAANFTLKVKWTASKQWFTGKRKYVITISMSDYYDFDYFGKKEKNYIKRCINDYFGYYPQKYGVLKNYWWKINFSFDYYK